MHMGVEAGDQGEKQRETYGLQARRWIRKKWQTLNDTRNEKCDTRTGGAEF